MAEMASRISNLEKALAKATDEQKTSRSGSTSHISEVTNTSTEQPASISLSGDLSKGPGEDTLVQKGSSSQYFNEVLWSKAIGEVSFIHFGTGVELMAT